MAQPFAPRKLGLYLIELRRVDDRLVALYCKLDEPCQKLIRGAYDRLGLTARGYDRILRVARTIADLDGAEEIQVQHLAEALQYRPPEHLRA